LGKEVVANAGTAEWGSRFIMQKSPTPVNIWGCAPILLIGASTSVAESAATALEVLLNHQTLPNAAIGANCKLPNSCKTYIWFLGKVLVEN